MGGSWAPPRTFPSMSDFGQSSFFGRYGTPFRMGVTVEDLLALRLSDQAWMRQMPPVLGDIARIIGLEATLRLAVHYGGESAYVPVWNGEHNASKGEIAPDKWSLSRVIGTEAALKLASSAFGGGVNLVIPSTFHGLAYRRLIAIAMLEKGATIREVCQSVGVARSTAHDWKKTYLDGRKPRRTHAVLKAPALPINSIEFEAASKPADMASASVTDDGGPEA